MLLHLDLHPQAYFQQVSGAEFWLQSIDEGVTSFEWRIRFHGLKKLRGLAKKHPSECNERVQIDYTKTAMNPRSVKECKV